MTRKIKLRSLLFGGVFTLLFIGLLMRIYWVQVVDAAMLREKAELMWETNKVLPPARGMILDRNLKVLAEDAPAYTVAVKPRVIHSQRLEIPVSEGLARILARTDDPAAIGRLKDKIMNQLNRKRQDGVSLLSEVEIRNEGWKIDTHIADLVNDLSEELKEKYHVKDSGIYLKKEIKRTYPGERLASHLLGYTNKDGEAVMGIEAYYNDLLQGTAGKLNYEADNKGVELPESKVSYVPPVDGKILRLTIDKNIQFFIENAMRKIYEQYRPHNMIGIAVDPKTMEILGMANLPDFDPNHYWETSDQSYFINRAVAAQFEPGSTFKLVTLAGAVEEGLFRPNDTYISGSIRVPGRTLHDWDRSWGRLTYLDGLKRSSNVAFVKLGYEMLGEEKLEEYIRRFGFGQKTGIDIAGEVSGMVNMRYPSEYATATYGQGLTVTAIQLTAAYAAVANGGKLMKPYVVKEIIDPETNEVVQSFGPTEVRRVVSAETARKVSEYLEQTVTDQEIGTGRKAYSEHYRVAGKTGTANIVVPGMSGYAKDQWVVSFIGYVPAEDPQILVTIIADRPDLQGDFRRASEVTIPVFNEIVSETMRYLGVPSQSQKQEAIRSHSGLIMPELEGLTVEEALKKTEAAGLAAELLGNGRTVLRQFPQGGTEIGVSQRIYLVTENGELPIPDLRGRSMRDAGEVLSLMGVRFTIEGEGYVTDQNIVYQNGFRVVELKLSPLNAPDGPEAESEDGQAETSAEATPDGENAEEDPASGT